MFRQKPGVAESFGAIDVHKHLQRIKADDPWKHFTDDFNIQFTLDAAAFPCPDQGKPQTQVYTARISRDNRISPVRAEYRLHDRNPPHFPKPILKTRNIHKLRKTNLQVEISLLCRKPVAGFVIYGNIPGFACIRHSESTGLRMLTCIIKIRNNALSAFATKPSLMPGRLHHEMSIHEIIPPLIHLPLLQGKVFLHYWF